MLCRILYRQCLAVRDDPVVGPKPGQTHTRTLPHHRTSRRSSDHTLHLPSREVGPSPKPTPILHIRTDHSLSTATGPGPAPQWVCFRQDSRRIKPTLARCCSLKPRSTSPDYLVASSVGRPGALPYWRTGRPEGSLSHDLSDTHVMMMRRRRDFILSSSMRRSLCV